MGENKSEIKNNKTPCYRDIFFFLLKYYTLKTIKYFMKLEIVFKVVIKLSKKLLLHNFFKYSALHLFYRLLEPLRLERNLMYLEKIENVLLLIRPTISVNEFLTYKYFLLGKYQTFNVGIISKTNVIILLCLAYAMSFCQYTQ